MVVQNLIVLNFYLKEYYRKMYLIPSQDINNDNDFTTLLRKAVEGGLYYFLKTAHYL